ncbi:MAG: hypothetical protein AAFY65_00795 [Pseudomonadota bacterium]
MIDTYSDLQGRLAQMTPSLGVIFATEEARTQGSWHLTRVTAVALSHIHCDGAQDTAEEVVLDILAARLGTPMEAGRFSHILAQAAGRRDGIGDLALRVSLWSARWQVSDLRQADGDVAVHLIPDPAYCRGAAKMAEGAPACC